MKHAAWFMLAGSLLLGTARAADPIDYAKQIRPIFKDRCEKCHGPDRDRGDLRLHEPAHILEAEIIVAGKPGESELFRRISLPEDDDDIMPPSGDPLTKEQIEIVRLWIEQGAKFTGDDGTVVVPERIEPPKEEELPNVDPAPAEALSAVRELGALVLPLAQNTNRLNVDFRSVAQSTTDESLAKLAGLSKQITWLNLARTKVTDAGLAALGNLKELRRLHLELTEVTDAGLASLAGLEHLEYLNLYGSKVTDQGIAHLAGLRKLKSLYVWQTGVTYEASKKLREAIPGLYVNLGWDNPGVQLEQAEKELAATLARMEEAAKAEEEARKAKEAASAQEEEAKQRRETAAQRKAELEKKIAELKGEKPPETAAAPEAEKKEGE
ncbi:MAG TPA: c-type cytochrome domain-containing protein [Planctomycetota bacterium]|nr:c-type cytochrome domain-containing protein [Planctomycetota bacterium]